MMTAAPAPHVTSLRWLLSLFFGGVGSLLPYLSLHCRSVGLSLQDASIISFASPLVAALGPLVAGPALDNFYCKKKSRNDVQLESNKCIRIILSVTIFLSALFYCLLVVVPAVPSPSSEPAQLRFMCDDGGAFLTQEQCGSTSCYQYPSPVHGLVRLADCAFDCFPTPFPNNILMADELDNSLETEVKDRVLPSSTILTKQTPAAVTPTAEPDIPMFDPVEPDMDEFFDNSNHGGLSDDEDAPKYEGSGAEDSSEWVRRERRDKDMTTTEEPLPPHICYGDQRMCSVYTPYSASVTVNMSVRQGLLQDHLCYYPLGGHFSCRVPHAMQSAGQPQCRVVCQLEDQLVAPAAALVTQCQQQAAHASLSFWLYLLFRSLGDLFTSVTISLLIGATLTAVRLRIGREFIAPSVAYALMTSVVGYLHSPDLSPFLLAQFPPFIFGLAGYALLSTLSIFVLIFAKEMPIGPPDWWTASKAVRCRHKTELWGLLMVLALLGTLWGPHFTYVPWHMSGTPGLEAYIGTSVALGALISVPFVWKVDFIIDFCGYSNILIAGFTFYIVRYTGLLLLRNTYVLFITGGLEVFTLSLVFFSAVLYLRHLVPKHLTFTAQSLGFAAHFCIGNGMGCLIAHFLSEAEPPHSLRETVHNSTTAEGSSDELNPHYILYYSGAIFSAVVASVYYLMYHMCLKRKCIAPNYRKPSEHQPAAMVQGSVRNGTYTPLTVFTNGRPNHATAD